MEFIKQHEFEIRIVFIILFTILIHFLYTRNEWWLNDKEYSKLKSFTIHKVVLYILYVIGSIGGLVLLLFCLWGGYEKIDEYMSSKSLTEQLLWLMSFVLFFYGIYVHRYRKQS